MTSKSIYHYTYIIWNVCTKMKYIGVRSSKCPPNEDSYMGSSSDQEMKMLLKEFPNTLKKRILQIFSNRKDALTHEIYLHNKYDVASNPKFYNKSKQTSTKFNYISKDIVTVRDLNGNTLQVSKDDPRWISGELVGVTKGRVAVKDVHNVISMVDTNHPDYISGKLVHHLKETVTVMDEHGKVQQVPIDHPDYTSGKLIHINTNKVTVRDPTSNKVICVPIDHPDYTSGKLIHIAIGTTRSDKHKKAISESMRGANNNSYKGKYCHTKYGEYETASELGKCVQLSKSMIVKIFWKDLDTQITQNQTRLNPYLKSLPFNPVGMTWRDLGFYFVPVTKEE